MHPNTTQNKHQAPLDPQQQAEQGSGSSVSQDAGNGSQQKPFFEPPTINLPKGGGAIQGIGEKFQANPVTGTGSMSVPIAMSPGRGGFTPQLALSYDSGAGNSPFGLGWNIGLPSISGKTSKGLPEYDGLPRYHEGEDADVFLLSGVEDLVPVYDDNERYERTDGDYTIHRYRPRIEGLFARIERWTKADGEVHWRSISKDNITTIYGETPNARIFDPAYPAKVFRWLIERTYDDRGNVIEYDYKKEDKAGLEGLIYERNRKSYAQTYLKGVRYGNTVPFQPLRDAFDRANYDATNKWLFELIIDYGDHEDDANGHPIFEPSDNKWPLRQDPYSSSRSGFEVRAYRLCRRILMYHHMLDQLEVENYLVKSTILTHEEGPVVSQLKSVQHKGYMIVDGDYQSKSFPAVTFKYSTVKVDHTVHTVTDDQLPNVPQGIDGSQYQFVDLYHEGVNGILAQRTGAWYYKENLGGGSFGPQREVATLPSPALAGSLQLTDYEGNGQIDAIVQNGTLNGYYELDEEREWSNYQPFRKPLSFPTNDPNARALDLNGDGIADYLLTENDCFLYYPSEGKEGFASCRRIAKQLDEEQGPRVVFKEATQTIFLADMSGDGLTDIVRIRNGEVCYWPNHGHGRFGAKVTMADAPRFDQPDYYDPARLRTVDINGTGTIDILYIGRQEIRYWLNASGNGWVKQDPITSFPQTTQLHTVSAFDFLGNGCACLVWSSPLPAQAGQPLKYIQLMTNAKGEAAKPYLLRETDNQMGAITRLEYAPSTEFSLADKAAGKPWITSIPFVVQVLKRQEVYDAISNNHFVTRYAYHHGYFDAAEREFRGFGMVEQWDTEHYESLKENSLFEVVGRNWAESSNQEPIVTKTWFDNGYWKQGKKITDHYKTEYYAGDPDAFTLPDVVLPSVSLSAQEEREAYRALKGNPLRVEVFGYDKNGQPKQHPYMVTHSAYEVKLEQRKGEARHASFFVHPTQTLTYHYEGNEADPRITHEASLVVNEYGQILESISLVYPRRGPMLYPEQKKVWAVHTKNDYINLDENDHFLRLGLLTFQVENEVDIDSKVIGKVFDPADFNFLSTRVRALLRFDYTTYYDEECTGQKSTRPLAAYHGIPFKTHQATFETATLEKAHGFNRTGNSKMTPEMLTAAGFEDQTALWFRPSSQVDYNPDQFFQPVKQHDPLSGQVYETGYDSHNLVATSTWFDFKGHTIASTGTLDYRTLQSKEITDPNGNKQAVLFDALGMVVVTAVMGSAEQGDTLSTYTLPPEFNDPVAVKNKALAAPEDLLQEATAFFYYDLFAFKRGTSVGSAGAADAGAEEVGGAVPPSPQRGSSPNFAFSLMREVHVSKEKGTPSPIQLSFAYSDGLGQTILTKTEAEPDAGTRRWIGSGHTVFNNKGNPVKQYEPYFSDTPAYEAEVKNGVSPTLHYDVLGRNVRTDLPDGTFTKVEFTSWEQRTYDQNDTVMDSQWYQDRGAPDKDGQEPRLLVDDPASFNKRAAWLAAQHHGTPKVEHLDTLGRVFLQVDDDGSPDKVKTRFVLNIQGSQVEVWDGLDRQIAINHYDLQQQPLWTQSMDAGNSWMLYNILGQPVQQWNDRKYTTRLDYDDLQRNTQTWVSEKGKPEQLVFLTTYGEILPNPAATNSFGQVIHLHDQAGVTKTEGYDFKGNPLETVVQVVQLAKEYEATIDYAGANGLTTSANILAALVGLMEATQYHSSSTFDALNRPVTQTTPDGSVTELVYNKTNQLKQLKLKHRGTGAEKEEVKDIQYNAKGQRTAIWYANGVVTKYDYDEKTFRLIQLKSTRRGGSETIQDLHYFYDPVGNITNILDNAQQDVFYANRKVSPHSSYQYDALYRLVKASGREQIALASAPIDPRSEPAFISTTSPASANALQRYERTYKYDKLGNILEVKHTAPPGGAGGWTRKYEYREASTLEPGKTNNYLSAITYGSGAGAARSAFMHDLHGNMTRMPHLKGADDKEGMFWDFADQLKKVRLNESDDHEYYTYTMAGGKDFGVRRRKLTVKAGTVHDRIYIGDYEVYRKYKDINSPTLARESLHLQDNTGRIALFETELDASGAAQGTTFRYQLNNHLGSAALELDEADNLISYEEYYPFGGSSYRSGRNAAEVKAKRYRYAGKERDEATGLDYLGARYYGSWLGRFCGVDPLRGLYLNVSTFVYGLDNPIASTDPDGRKVVWRTKRYDKIKDSINESSIYKSVFAKLLRDIDNVFIMDANTEKVEFHGRTVSKENSDDNTFQIHLEHRYLTDPTLLFKFLLHEGLHIRYKMVKSEGLIELKKYPTLYTHVKKEEVDSSYHAEHETMAEGNIETFVLGMIEFDETSGLEHSLDWYRAMAWYGSLQIHTSAWSKLPISIQSRYEKIMDNEVAFMKYATNPMDKSLEGKVDWKLFNETRTPYRVPLKNSSKADEDFNMLEKSPLEMIKSYY